MTRVDFPVGTCISHAAQMLCEAAAEHGCVSGRFNNITLEADALSIPGDIERQYDEKVEAARVRFVASPRGQARAHEAVLRLRDMQIDTDMLMRELNRLDWSSDVAVLDWLVRYTEAADHIEVEKDREKIVVAFYSNGFVSNANLGKHHRPNDRDNVFRYLVGQALDGIRSMGVPMGILICFASQWRAKFLGEAA